MKYKVTSFFKKAIAAILTFFMSFCATQTPQEPERPEENSVTDYDKISADYTLDIDASEKSKAISDLLFGIFFEDINFAADGGLYAEKIVNRSFEYTEIAENDRLYGWNKVGNAEIEVKVGDKENGLNINNTNYIIIKSSSPAGIENRGFLDGMSIAKDEKYKNNKVWTAVLNDADQGYPYIKRFAFEPTTKKLSFIGENAASELLLLSDNKYPRFQVTFGGADSVREPLIIDAEEYIGEKSYKAKGKRVTTFEVDNIKEIEPREVPEEELEEPEIIEETVEEEQINQNDVRDELTGQMRLFDNEELK